MFDQEDYSDPQPDDTPPNNRTHALQFLITEHSTLRIIRHHLKMNLVALLATGFIHVRESKHDWTKDQTSALKGTTVGSFGTSTFLATRIGKNGQKFTDLFLVPRACIF